MAFENARYRVLVVCMGNICRSPLAEGVLRARLEARLEEPAIYLDSAGTHGYHAGAPPDRRAQAAAARRGFDIAALRARRVAPEDFERFDLILAMDRENLTLLREQAPPEHHDKLRLFLEFASGSPGDEVPDPYYGSALGFERVLDMIEDGVAALLPELERRSRERAG